MRAGADAYLVCTQLYTLRAMRRRAVSWVRECGGQGTGIMGGWGKSNVLQDACDHGVMGVCDSVVIRSRGPCVRVWRLEGVGRN